MVQRPTPDGARPAPEEHVRAPDSVATASLLDAMCARIDATSSAAAGRAAASPRGVAPTARTSDAADAVSDAVCKLLQGWQRHHDRDDLAAALVAVQRALLLAPDDPHVHHRRALTLIELGYVDEALDAADQAIRLAPTAPDGFEVRSVVLHRAGLKEEAVRAARRGSALRGSKAPRGHEGEGPSAPPSPRAPLLDLDLPSVDVDLAPLDLDDDASLGASEASLDVEPLARDIDPRVDAASEASLDVPSARDIDPGVAREASLDVEPPARDIDPGVDAAVDAAFAQALSRDPREPLDTLFEVLFDAPESSSVAPDAVDQAPVVVEHAPVERADPEPSERRAGARDLGAPPELSERRAGALDLGAPPEPSERRAGALDLGAPPEPSERRAGALDLGAPPEPSERRAGARDLGTPPEPSERRAGALDLGAPPDLARGATRRLEAPGDVVLRSPPTRPALADTASQLATWTDAIERAPLAPDPYANRAAVRSDEAWLTFADLLCALILASDTWERWNETAELLQRTRPMLASRRAPAAVLENAQRLRTLGATQQAARVLEGLREVAPDDPRLRAQRPPA